MSGSTTFEIGGNIKKLREFRGYSQEYMATKLDVSQRTYSNIESDTGKVNKQQIEHIAKILEIEPIQLLTFDDKVVFNNENCHQPQLGGMYNTFHAPLNADVEPYKELVKQLKEENTFLKDEITFLKSLIKKQ